MSPYSRLTVAGLRRWAAADDDARSRGGALVTIARRTCPYGAGPDETCDTVPQPFILPDVCAVCDARRALNEIGGSW